MEAELIALAQLRAKRHPSLLIRFVPTGDGKATYPERKCTCKRPLTGITFCHCFCDRDDDSTRPDATGRLD